MKSIILKALRWFLGLFMIIIGLNKFLVFITIPNPPGDGGTLMTIYITSGFLKVIGVLEIIGGITLLINKFVPIGLTLITAIMFNATLFHVLHDPSGVGPAFFCLAMSLVLIFGTRGRFSNFFTA